MKNRSGTFHHIHLFRTLSFKLFLLFLLKLPSQTFLWLVTWVRKAWRSRANVWVGGYFCCFLNWPQSFIYSLGLLSDEPVLQQKTPLDTLCLYLTKKLAYGRKTLSLLVAFISWSDKKLASLFSFLFSLLLYLQSTLIFLHSSQKSVFYTGWEAEKQITPSLLFFMV